MTQVKRETNKQIKFKAANDCGIACNWRAGEQTIDTFQTAYFCVVSQLIFGVPWCEKCIQPEKCDVKTQCAVGAKWSQN